MEQKKSRKVWAVCSEKNNYIEHAGAAYSSVGILCFASWVSFAVVRNIDVAGLKM